MSKILEKSLKDARKENKLTMVIKPVPNTHLGPNGQKAIPVCLLLLEKKNNITEPTLLK